MGLAMVFIKFAAVLKQQNILQSNLKEAWSTFFNKATHAAGN